MTALSKEQIKKLKHDAHMTANCEGSGAMNFTAGEVQALLDTIEARGKEIAGLKAQLKKLDKIVQDGPLAL